ncbi:MAG: plasmid mobilization protein [Dysgonomonas sp.]
MTENDTHKNKGGRPKKSRSERKSKTIAVCFSEREYMAIKYRASKANLSLSEYCHSAVLKGKIAEPIKKEDMETLKGLSYVGNNLNQFVKLAHFADIKDFEKRANVLLNQIQYIIANLSDDWKSSKRKKL